MKLAVAAIFSFVFYITSFSQENWVIDNAHSNLRFEVGWEDFSMRTGEFKVFNGTVVSKSREDLSDAEFTFTVDASSVDVIADRLAEQIRSDRFLDVEKYPEITFVASGAEKTGENTYVSKGNLTIHGVEKEQEVTFTLKGIKETRNSYIMGLEAHLTVDRTDFGLDWGSPRLAEKITLVGHLLYKLETEEEEEE